MSDDFLARLREGRLTCSEKYQRTRNADVWCERQETGAESEEWKNWQLLPVTGANGATNQEGAIDADSATGRGVYQALRTLDKITR